MATAASLEPFPLFIDAAAPNAANYFSSPMAMAAIQLMASPISNPLRKPRVSMSAKVSNYLRLRYYQYQVTFGLYMMTRTEKLIFNTVILAVLAAFVYALFWGFEPFLVSSLCRSTYYVTGSCFNTPGPCSRWRASGVPRI